MVHAIIDFSAVANLKEVPNSLEVTGKVQVYTADAKAKILRAEPQGINPTVLLLDLTVAEGTGPRKGIEKGFHYVEKGDSVIKYESVTIRCENNDKTKRVKRLG